MKRPLLKIPGVVLVGAGPGNAELLTPAAKKAIRSADVVFHDALVSPEILRMIPLSKRVPVGKRGGLPSIPQPQINALLLRAAKRGRNVVRLKGGDPFMFGRGGEESTFLRAHGIPVRTVPGITSAMAAAASAGFPLTDRRWASAVTFMTATGAAPEMKIDFRSLAKIGGTVVFYMGLRSLPSLTKNFIRAGASPATPAAVISAASRPEQRVVVAPIRDIAEKAQKHRLASPALTIVGRVVRLRPPPLLGVPVLVLRPKSQAGRFSSLLKAEGAQVTECPVVDIVPIRPNLPLDRAIGRLNQYDWIVLTSGNSVRLLRSRLRRISARIAAIGPGTAEALSEAGIRADLVPPADFRAEGLAAEFIKRNRRPQKIFLPRAESGRDILVKELRRAGHAVDAVPIYRTIASHSEFSKIRRWIQSVKSGIVPFTSASMAKFFARAARGLSVRHLRFAAIGPITGREASARGIQVSAESPKSTIPLLVETLATLA